LGYFLAPSVALDLSRSDLSDDLATLDTHTRHALALGLLLGGFQPLCLEGLEVAHHGVPRELLAGDERVFLQGPLDQRVATGLVEEGDAVAFAVVVVGLRGRFDAVEGRFEAVVGPGHQEVADVADDGVGRWGWVDFGPGVTVAEGGGDFAAGTDLIGS